MHYKALILGLLFLANPQMNIIDVFPDAIGFALIIYALSPLVKLSPSIEEAQLNAKKLCLLSIGKMGAVFVLYSIAAEEKTFFLLFTFCFTLFESLYLSRFFSFMFAGTEYVNSRFAKDSFVSSSSAKAASLVFTAVRAIFTVLPEMEYFPAFYMESDMLSEVNVSILTPYKNLLIIANVLMVTIIAVFWLAVTVPYLLKLKKNRAMNESAAYAADKITVSPVKNLLIYSKYANYIAALGFLLMTDLYIDGLNPLPDFLGIALVMLALLLISKSASVDIGKSILGFIALAVSLASLGLNVWFWKKLYPIGLIRFSKIALQFFIILALIAIGAVFTVLFLHRFKKAFCEAVDRHVGIEASPEFVKLNRENERVRKGLHTRASIAFALACISEVSSVLSFALIYVLPHFRIFGAIVAVLLTWCVYSMIFEYREQVALKYRP